MDNGHELNPHVHARRYLRAPADAEEAARNIEALLSVPFCRVLGEEDGFWNSYREMTQEVPTRGNLVPDAHLAALLTQHGIATLYTRDFRRFTFLNVRDPLEEQP